MKKFSFIGLLLAIELFDELVFGVQVAAWPSIRDDLALTYVQMGILLSLPGIFSSIVEPLIGIAGDSAARRNFIITGGIVYVAALAVIGVGNRFSLLLLSFMIIYPASGAFVSLSQATLMDLEPDERERNMAKWTFFGSMGNVGGPLVLSFLLFLGTSWRGAYYGLVILGCALLVNVQRYPKRSSKGSSPSIADGVVSALRALKNRRVVRWLVLLESADLMLDVLLGYLALYLVDIAGATPATAGTAVAVWTGVGLIGDLLLIPLLKKVRGLIYLKISAIVTLGLYPLFLLIDPLEFKFVVIAALGLFNAGWYSILKARLYEALPEKSGTAMALSSLSGLVGSLIPLGLGFVAETFGLNVTMWLLVAGPLSLLIGLPDEESDQK